VADTNFKSDAFRKVVTSGMPPSHVRDGPGFCPRKPVLGSATLSTGKRHPWTSPSLRLSPKKSPSTNVKPRPWDNAGYLHQLRCPDIPPKPSQRDIDVLAAVAAAKLCRMPPPPTGHHLAASTPLPQARVAAPRDDNSAATSTRPLQPPLEPPGALCKRAAKSSQRASQPAGRWHC
jgi:hypothetical protein